MFEILNNSIITKRCFSMLHCLWLLWRPPHAPRLNEWLQLCPRNCLTFGDNQILPLSTSAVRFHRESVRRSTAKRTQSMTPTLWTSGIPPRFGPINTVSDDPFEGDNEDAGDTTQKSPICRTATVAHENNHSHFGHSAKIKKKIAIREAV